MNLYLFHTRGLGSFYIISQSLDTANIKLQGMLSAANYGFSSDRNTIKIDILATEIQDSFQSGIANFSARNMLILPESCTTKTA